MADKELNSQLSPPLGVNKGRLTVRDGKETTAKFFFYY